ncbi:MAG TPA: hypothetical protein VEC38_10080 [Candidatus Binataceae bacterium]|nr:hypothetical protein [Candidatus Binataceae bacterium]
MKSKPSALQSASRAARAAIAIAALIASAGCGIASAPIKDTNQVVATPQPGQLNVSVQSHATVGQIVPVYVSIANGTDMPRAVVPSQVFAINEAGERVAPLPPGEAARQAGDAGELKAALTSATVSGAAAGAVGAGLGAAAGSAFGAVGQGAIVGTAIGAAHGIFRGAENGQSKADQQAREQIEALALKPADVNHDFTISGYVFYPKGSYQRIEMLLVDRETGDTEIVKEPWR